MDVNYATLVLDPGDAVGDSTPECFQALFAVDANDLGRGYCDG